jgi:hypothetical protein
MAAVGRAVAVAGGGQLHRGTVLGVAALSDSASTLVVVDWRMTKARHSLHLCMMGHMVMKGLAGDSNGRRQEGGLNTIITQKRDVRQSCQGHR